MNASPPPNGKILGIDVGQHKIGLAVGDPATGFAFARPTLVVKDWAQAWPPIVQLAREEQIEHIVVGWPLNTDGTTGPQAEQSRLFAAALQQQIPLPIDFHDERFSTQAVQRQAQSADQPVVNEDSRAAQLLVEAYLQTRR